MKKIQKKDWNSAQTADGRRATILSRINMANGNTFIGFITESNGFQTVTTWNEDGTTTIPANAIVITQITVTGVINIHKTDLGYIAKFFLDQATADANTTDSRVASLPITWTE
jgi:hypothetical protein